MEKSRVAVIALLAVVAMIAGLVASENRTCSAQDFACPDDGDACTGDFQTNDTDACIKDQKCCAIPLLCINGQCVESSRDLSCNKSEECHVSGLSSFLMDCHDNKCVAQVNFNDSCREDYHCSGNMKCVKKGTSEVGVCAALNISDECGFEPMRQECGANARCALFIGKCQAVKDRDEECASASDCDIYSICHNKKCVKGWSAEEGEECHDDELKLISPFIGTCKKGLYCDTKEKVCKKPVKHEKVLCLTDDDCTAKYGNSSSCSMCDSNNGGFYCSAPENDEVDCVPELMAAFECFRKNYCAPMFTTSVDTCAQIQCTAETNAVLTCRSKCEDLKLTAGRKCVASLMLRYCPLIPTWLRIVIAFSILIAIIVVVFIIYGIFRVVKKKNNYKEVPSSPDN